MKRAIIMTTIIALSAFVYVSEVDAKKKSEEITVLLSDMCNNLEISCLLNELEKITDKIENKNWRDQTYREIAKLLAHQKKVKESIQLLNKIENPDTKALTIRGIGMSAAHTDMDEEDLTALFVELRDYADNIQHPPSHAIALTYIAMAQAFSGDNKGALTTALDMKNDALRNKALGETAEIQAENSDLENALDSISYIDSDAVRNKTYRLVSKIFAQQKEYEKAIDASDKIDNAYQRAQAVLFILAKQITPEEVSLVE